MEIKITDVLIIDPKEKTVTVERDGKREEIIPFEKIGTPLRVRFNVSDYQPITAPGMVLMDKIQVLKSVFPGKTGTHSQEYCENSLMELLEKIR